MSLDLLSLIEHDMIAYNHQPTMPGMGLIDQPYPTDEAFDPQRSKQPWERFINLLNSWNESEKGKAAYKLIYVTRHGQGYHNAKESDVGSAEWEVRSNHCWPIYLIMLTNVHTLD